MIYYLCGMFRSTGGLPTIHNCSLSGIYAVGDKTNSVRSQNPETTISVNDVFLKMAFS